ncbi:MAG: efflux RND transporter periplasmic adaptor subunit [Gammaproteobacteria bacterium]|nr:efflux RND transporter periplasmic adaptor subunit [Gammaproteobacteria bacterium]
MLTVVALFFSLSVMAEDALPVTVKTVQQLVFHPVKKAPAQVVTLQNSLLSAEIAALVNNVHVQVGDTIDKDQLLVTLECDDFELNKQQLIADKGALEADREFAEYQFERSEKLLKSKNISQELHRRQAAGLKKLDAQIQLVLSKIQQADKMISRCEIKAPFAGVIAQRLINKGENVAPHTPLIRLIDVNNLEVEVQVPIVVVDDLDYKSLDFVYRKQRYPLEIRAIIPSIETRARHQRVRLRFVDKKALPDAFGMVEITLRELNIPANYLLTRHSQVGIFLLKKVLDDQLKEHFEAQFYPLKNALTGRAAAVDLPLHSKVIIDGRNALSDGQKVVVQQAQSLMK